MKKHLALYITRIFDPLIIMTVTAFFAVNRSSLSEQAKIPFFLLSAGLMIGEPVLLFLLALKNSWISDWDVRKRKERPLALAILLMCEIGSVIILKPFLDTVLLHFSIIVITWIIGFTVITLKWKISGHSGITALASGMFVMWYGRSYWPLLLLVIPVAWSRIVRKNHTLEQVIVGAEYSWALLIILRFLFGIS